MAPNVDAAINDLGVDGENMPEEVVDSGAEEVVDSGEEVVDSDEEEDVEYGEYSTHDEDDRVTGPPVPLDPHARDPRLDLLASAITQKAPYCGGTFVVPNDHLKLFYAVDKAKNAKIIDMAQATQDELHTLAAACQAATFGVNQQDVLDESYRKAGKLDSNDFSTRLEGITQKLLDIIHPELLQGHDDIDTNTIEAELYKLNVYGEGSFFKSHKDTPRSEKMFGSLVITFPTPHEGGALVLRHDGQEWTHDPSKLLQYKESDDRIAYVAFYSDVEHEVLPVTAGHRVTLTYNLYFGEVKAHAQGARPADRPHEEAFAKQLRELLADSTFLPAGGLLGFGLQHSYPVATEGDVTNMAAYLKGTDAVIAAVCKAAGLQVKVKLSYTQDGVTVLRDTVLPEGWYIELVEEMVNYMRSKGDGIIVDSKQADYPVQGLRVHWVTPRTDLGQVKTPYLVYGNGAELDYTYGKACLIVEVPNVEERSIPA